MKQVYIFLVILISKWSFSQKAPLTIPRTLKLPRTIPWSAVVQLDRIPICGGSIIDEKNVLTSAVCCNLIQNKNAKIQVGSDHLGHYGTEVKIKECYTHEAYNKFTGANDIAIIKLDEDLIFSNKIAKAIFPDRNYTTTVSKEGSFMVWSKKVGSNYLSYKILSIKCILLIPIKDVPSWRMFLQDFLCLREGYVSRRNCKNVIGASYTINNVTVGIVNFSRYCDDGSMPILYITNINRYYEWIQANILK